MQNNEGRVGHIYASAEDQCRGNVACEICSPSEVPCTPSQEVDLLMSGSPCKPFSTQRAKRYVNGDVCEHTDFATTMGTVLDMYKSKEPKIGIFEQVMGFCKPIAAGSKETPKHRWGAKKGNKLSHFLFRRFNFNLNLGLYRDEMSTPH